MFCLRNKKIISSHYTLLTKGLCKVRYMYKCINLMFYLTFTDISMVVSMGKFEKLCLGQLMTGLKVNVLRIIDLNKSGFFN